MALLTPSPLVAALRGKVGSAVCAVWKGRQYVRMWVLPHNPQTDLQMAQREALGRIPTLWRSLLADIKAALDAYAADYRMSGYNWFAKQNVVHEKTFDSAFITPPSILIDPVGSLELTDDGAGVCTVTWAGGTQSADHKVTIYSRLVETDEEAEALDLEEEDTTLTSAETYEATLAASKTFRVFVINEDTADDSYSEAVSKEVVMGA